MLTFFVQHNAPLPIKQVIETPRSDQSKVNTVFVLNIDSFKEFKKEFAKASIVDSYWEDPDNSSFMKHANAYVAQLLLFIDWLWPNTSRLIRILLMKYKRK